MKLNIDLLKKMLEELPQRERDTARRIWDDYDWRDSEDDDPLFGLRSSAKRYKLTILIEKSKIKPNPKESPHLVEKELEKIAASARDLRSKLEHISPTSLTWIEKSSINYPPPNAEDWVEGQFFASVSDLHAWFRIRRICASADVSMEEGPCWGRDGERPMELEALAQSLDWIARGAEATKQSPNGARKGDHGRAVALEWMLYCVGRMSNFRKCPKAHTLPIARVVHEWATGERPGNTWGDRPLDKINPDLRKLRWIETDEQRDPGPAVASYSNPSEPESLIEAMLRDGSIDLGLPPRKGKPKF